MALADVQAALTPEFQAAAEPFSAQDQVRDAIIQAGADDPFDVLLHLDTTKYLHGLLLVEDKVSMAHSLETRVPLLDNALADYLLKAPKAHLFDGVTGKIVFREAVRPWVPETIYRKPKMGFGPPDASWYRTALRPFVESRLAERRVRARGVLQWPYVERILHEHMSGAANHVSLLWSLLSLDSWCQATGFYGGRLNL